jgi:hypothetical protein
MGMTGEQAIQWVRESIPGAMESKHQEEFVVKYQNRGKE